MAKNRISGEIAEYLAQGKSSGEVIALGYARGTVYKVQHDMRRQAGEPAVRSFVGATGGSRRQADRSSVLARNGDQERSQEGLELVKEEPLRHGSQRSPRTKSMVKFQYRPQVFAVDESIVYVYHLFMAHVQRIGSDYDPTLGEWVKDTVFELYKNHPGVLDIRSVFRE